MKARIKIFVVCHKPSYVPDINLLVPIQVGASLADFRFKGMKSDDEGENISDKNSEYCELTAQYWAWKNDDADYYGFFHYRRYLSFRDVYPVDREGRLAKRGYICPYIELDSIKMDLSVWGVDEQSIEEQVCQYDLLTVLREKIDITVYQQYCQYHEKKYIDMVLEILKRKYPEYQNASEIYMNSKEVYYMNMYVMQKTLFQEYMAWLFDVLEEFDRYVDRNGEKPAEQRLRGYLAERLFGIFYTYQRKSGAKCAEVPYLRFYSTGGDDEENQKNIREFRLKPTRLAIKIDMRKLNRLFPPGSKRRIVLRHIILK